MLIPFHEKVNREQIEGKTGGVKKDQCSSFFGINIVDAEKKFKTMLSNQWLRLTMIPYS